MLLTEHFRSLHALNDLLRTVSMMHIKVYYGNPLDLVTVSVLEVRSCHSDVVNVAEAVGLLLIALVVFESLTEDAGVVTWWPHCAERIPEVSGHNLVARLHHCTSGK